MYALGLRKLIHAVSGMSLEITARQGLDRIFNRSGRFISGPSGIGPSSCFLQVIGTL
jgi:hypothetical protein